MNRPLAIACRLFTAMLIFGVLALGALAFSKPLALGLGLVVAILFVPYLIASVLGARRQVAGGF